MKSKTFNEQEIEAIIRGDKTMFREVIKPQLIQPAGFSEAYFDCYNKSHQWNWWAKDHKQFLDQVIKSKFKVGQEIFVKQQESRITLKIKSMKVEKLKDINDEDCEKEGAVTFKKGYPQSQFAFYWDSNHKKLEHKYEANPWVFVYEFEAIK